MVDAGKASTSLLQRRLRIGYARAARIVEAMEDKNIVAPADGARPRDVLIGSVAEGLNPELAAANNEEDEVEDEEPTPQPEDEQDDEMAEDDEVEEIETDDEPDYWNEDEDPDEEDKNS